MGKDNNSQRAKKSSAQLKAEALALKKAAAAGTLFSLRDATDEDMPTINAYTSSEGMDVLPSPENTRVAVNSAGEIVGLIHISIGTNGVAYVNPVVTAANWRKTGVGRALMESELVDFKELRLISRGNATGFYKRLGYQELPWSDMDEVVLEDCDGCDHVEQCRPVPMGKKLSE